MYQLIIYMVILNPHKLAHGCVFVVDGGVAAVLSVVIVVVGRTRSLLKLSRSLLTIISGLF